MSGIQKKMHNQIENSQHGNFLNVFGKNNHKQAHSGITKLEHTGKKVKSEKSAKSVKSVKSVKSGKSGKQSSDKNHAIFRTITFFSKFKRIMIKHTDSV